MEFRRIQDADAILAQIDPNDVDIEILGYLKDEEEGVMTIFAEGEAVGVALLDDDEDAGLYVYIFPQHRRRGYGREAAKLLEEQLREANCREIEIGYRADVPAAAALVAEMGYEAEFSSAYMEYSGPEFDCGEISVRQYEDADYPQVQAFTSEAFHLMRLSTGCFPDSVQEKPNEERRKKMAEAADKRFVYLQDGEIVAYGYIDEAMLETVAVKPTRQGEGIGRKFVGWLVNQIRKNGHETVSLYCVVGNARARKLYDSLGFVECYRSCYARKDLVKS